MVVTLPLRPRRKRVSDRFPLFGAPPNYRVSQWRVEKVEEEEEDVDMGDLFGGDY